MCVYTREILASIGSFWFSESNLFVTYHGFVLNGWITTRSFSQHAARHLGYKSFLIRKTSEMCEFVMISYDRYPLIESNL